MIPITSIDDPRISPYRTPLKDRDVARHGNLFIAKAKTPPDSSQSDFPVPLRPFSTKSASKNFLPSSPRLCPLYSAPTAFDDPDHRFPLPLRNHLLRNT